MNPISNSLIWTKGIEKGNIENKRVMLNFLGIVVLTTFGPILLVFPKVEKDFPIKKDLNQNTIQCIEQDRYGFLWYGTQNGPIRYEVTTFKTYNYPKPKPSRNILSNDIKKLFNDDQGIIMDRHQM